MQYGWVVLMSCLLLSGAALQAQTPDAAVKAEEKSLDKAADVDPKAQEWAKEIVEKVRQAHRRRSDPEGRQAHYYASFYEAIESERVHAQDFDIPQAYQDELAFLAAHQLLEALATTVSAGYPKGQLYHWHNSYAKWTPVSQQVVEKMIEQVISTKDQSLFDRVMALTTFDPPITVSMLAAIESKSLQKSVINYFFHKKDFVDFVTLMEMGALRKDYHLFPLSIQIQSTLSFLRKIDDHIQSSVEKTSQSIEKMRRSTSKRTNSKVLKKENLMQTYKDHERLAKSLMNDIYPLLAAPVSEELQARFSRLFDQAKKLFIRYRKRLNFEPAFIHPIEYAKVKEAAHDHGYNGKGVHVIVFENADSAVPYQGLRPNKTLLPANTQLGLESAQHATHVVGSIKQLAPESTLKVISSDVVANGSLIWNKKLINWSGSLYANNESIFQYQGIINHSPSDTLIVKSLGNNRDDPEKRLLFMDQWSIPELFMKKSLFVVNLSRDNVPHESSDLPDRQMDGKGLKGTYLLESGLRQEFSFPLPQADALKFQSMALSAIGSDVLSPIGRDQGKIEWGRCTGTSMAAPQVTGVAALLEEAFPMLLMSEIKEALLYSARKEFTVPNETGGRTIYYYDPLTTGLSVARAGQFKTINQKRNPDFEYRPFPPDVYGQGILDAERAFLCAQIIAMVRYGAKPTWLEKHFKNNLLAQTLIKDIAAHREGFSQAPEYEGDINAYREQMDAIKVRFARVMHRIETFHAKKLQQVWREKKRSAH